MKTVIRAVMMGILLAVVATPAGAANIFKRKPVAEEPPPEAASNKPRAVRKKAVDDQEPQAEPSAAVKAAVKRRKPALKAAEKDLVAASREEYAKRQPRLKARAAREAAENAFMNEPTVKNRQKLQSAIDDYDATKSSHEDSLTKFRKSRAKRNQLLLEQRQATEKVALAEMLPSPPKKGKPRFNRAAQIAPRQITVHRYPSIKQLYAGVSPEMVIAAAQPDPGYTMPGAPGRGRPAGQPIRQNRSTYEGAREPMIF